MKPPERYPVLVTAFEEFAQRKVNASEIVLDLQGKAKLSERIRLQRCVLPVQWKKTFAILQKRVKTQKPKLIILLGESGRTKISIERQASPHNAALADNLGKFPRKQVSGERKHVLLSNLEKIKMLKKTFTERGLPCAYSDDAGNYLCNFIYYKTLESCTKNSEIVFIHIPAQYTETRDGKELLRRCAQAIAEFMANNAE